MDKKAVLSALRSNGKEFEAIPILSFTKSEWCRAIGKANRENANGIELEKLSNEIECLAERLFMCAQKEELFNRVGAKLETLASVLHHVGMEVFSMLE